MMESLKPTFTALEAIKKSMPSTELAEDRDADSYRADVSSYVDKIRATMPAILAEIVALTQPSSAITVINNTDRYLADVEVKIHVSDPVEAAESEAFDLRGLLRDRLPTRSAPGALDPTLLATSWRGRCGLNAS